MFIAPWCTVVQSTQGALLDGKVRGQQFNHYLSLTCGVLRYLDFFFACQIYRYRIAPSNALCQCTVGMR